jgi:hypothetical protein
LQKIGRIRRPKKKESINKDNVRIVLSDDIKMERNKKLGMIFEISLFILFLALFPFIRKDILIFAFYTVIYFYIVFLKRESLEYLGLSTLIAIIWVTIARHYYVYSPDMVTLFGLSVYPMLAWALGLLGLRELYDHVKPKNTLKAIIVITITYMVSLIILETLSYHVIGFRNPGPYPGLPLCDCIHAPVFMQIYYLSIGPIYYMLTLLLDKFIKKD